MWWIMKTLRTASKSLGRKFSTEIGRFCAGSVGSSIAGLPIMLRRTTPKSEAAGTLSLSSHSAIIAAIARQTPARWAWRRVACPPWTRRCGGGRGGAVKESSSARSESVPAALAVLSLDGKIGGRLESEVGLERKASMLALNAVQSGHTS